MADALKDIIRSLEQQRSAIEKALSALREVDGGAGGGSAAPQARPEASAPAVKKGRRKGGITAEGRRKLSESLRARWAAKRADQPTPAAAAAKKYTGKRRGRKPRAS